MLKNVIAVTRHPGAVEWLRKQGIQPTRVIPHVLSENEIANKIVVGTLPYRLIFYPKIFGRIRAPGQWPVMPHDHDWTAQEMFDAGMVIEWISVRRLTLEEVIKELDEHDRNPAFHRERLGTY